MRNRPTIGPLLVAFVCMVAVGQAADLKTFTSEKYGFSVAHPADWKIGGQTEHNLMPGDQHPKGTQNAFQFDCVPDHSRPCSVLVSVHDAKPQTFEEFSKFFKGMVEGMSQGAAKVNPGRKLTVNGVEGYEIVYGEGSFFGKTRLVVFFQNGKRYSIMMTSGMEAGDFEKDASKYEAFVQTFRVVK